MRRIFLLIGMFVFCLSLPVWGLDSPENEKPQPQKWSFPYTKEVGIISGYAHGNLMEKGSYKIMPIIVRLGFNLDSIGLGFCDLLNPIARKLDVRLKGFTEIVLEPFANAVFTPDSNVEAGCTVLIKYSYPLTEKIYPYSFGGGGMAYLSQHTREQSTQWGFTPQIGTGVSYFFRKDMAFNVEYRYRHFSNANIKTPNEGINVNMFLFGVSLFY
ncbi:MAG: acyloxyacyl hydrolase [Candidatus Omnitrophota bacterium]